MVAIYKVLAGNMKRLRKERSMTQERLAEKAGVSQNHIAEIETGKKAASLEMVEKLASGLGVSPWELIFDGEDPAATQAALLRILPRSLAQRVQERTTAEVANFFQTI
jgi:transcriptional regulator with XRE-family HTH domain